MPLINLIREDRSQAQDREKKTRIALGATAVLGGLTFMVGFYFMIEATKLNLYSSDLQNQKKKIEPLVKELKDDQNKVADFKPRLATLEQAEGNTLKWNRVLDHLSKNMPTGMWLTSFKAIQGDKTKPLIITMNGLSLSQEKVGELILRMGSSADLENVQLKFTSERQSDPNGPKTTEFEISAELVGSKPEEPKDKKENS